MADRGIQRSVKNSLRQYHAKEDEDGEVIIFGQYICQNYVSHWCTQEEEQARLKKARETSEDEYGYLFEDLVQGQHLVFEG